MLSPPQRGPRLLRSGHLLLYRCSCRGRHYIKSFYCLTLLVLPASPTGRLARSYSVF